MKITVATCQRYDDKSLLEWIAYYQMQGVDDFVFLHHNMPGARPDPCVELWDKLEKYIPVKRYHATGYEFTETSTGKNLYQFIMTGARLECDWLIWADADTFYLPMEKYTIREVLQDYDQHQISALGVYWCTYGSNNLETEPDFITQGFTRRSLQPAVINHHINSIIKGRHAGNVDYANTPHYFTSSYGTVDTNLTPIHHPLNVGAANPWDVMRINHYYNRSAEYWRTVKSYRGPGDRPPEAVGGTIPDTHNYREEHNEEYDNFIWEKYGSDLTERVRILKNYLEQ